MRAWLIGLGLPLVVACAGKSVGSGEPTQASVEASLPGWCQSTCENLSICEGAKSNGIESVADCAQNCRAELTEGARRSQACAQRIEQFKSCVDAQGCAVVGNDEVCSLDNAKECDDDDDVDSVSPGAGPVPGAGGSAPGPGPSPGPVPGTAGGSSGAIPSSPAVHCSSGSGTAGAGQAPAGAQVICETGYGDCSNGSSYFATCVSTSEGRSSCSCFVNSKLSTAFDPGGVCPSPMQLNYGCGWNIQ
jgi:hypothetical protein